MINYKHSFYFRINFFLFKYMIRVIKDLFDETIFHMHRIHHRKESNIKCSVFENTFNIFFDFVGYIYKYSKACCYYRCEIIFLNNFVHLLAVFYFINNLKINDLKILHLY